MIVLKESELAALGGSAALALYSSKALQGQHGSKCPFHRLIFFFSTSTLVGGGAYIIWRSLHRGQNSGSSGDVNSSSSSSELKKRQEQGSDDGTTSRGPAIVDQILSLVRKNILELEPYRCARDDYSEGILLDANENSFGSTLPPKDQAMKLERYPDPYQHELKEKVAGYRGVRPEQIFIGVGSDEAIDLIMRIFCVPGKDKIIITPPTYGMYKVSAKTNDVGIISVPLTPTFDVRVTELLAAVTPETKLIFLCSPGNPTAKLVSIDVIEQVLKGAPATVVIVDEAYIDFAKPSVKNASACQLVDKYPNLLVLQTLSKAFGLAGIRCGMAIGHPKIIQIMNNVKAPYNLSQLTSNMAHKAFENLDVLDKNVHAILKEKQRVVDTLQSFPLVKKIHPSDTNFILFEVPKAQEIYKEMAQSGVVARFRGNELHCKDCIRLTIGKPHENDSFLKLFMKTAQKYINKYT